MDPIEEGLMALQMIEKLNKSNEIDWVQIDGPAPGAYAYSGTAGTFSIMVVQADVEGRGRVFEGMAVAAGKGINVIKLPPQLCETLVMKAMALTMSKPKS